MICLSGRDYWAFFVDDEAGPSQLGYAVHMDTHYGAGSYIGYTKFHEELDRDIERLGPELAMAPRELECYGCGGFNGRDFVMRKVVALGPVLEPHRDPTQSYKLECGHVMI